MVAPKLQPLLSYHGLNSWAAICAGMAPHEHRQQDTHTLHEMRTSDLHADSPPAVDIEHILRSLNAQQLKGDHRVCSRLLYTVLMPLVVAVKFDPSVPLQILAGPGSGKTKVCEDFSSPRIGNSYQSGPHFPHRALDCFAQTPALFYMRRYIH